MHCGGWTKMSARLDSQVVNALVKSNKDFEFIMIPGAGHGIGEGEYLFHTPRFLCSCLQEANFVFR